MLLWVLREQARNYSVRCRCAGRSRPRDGWTEHMRNGGVAFPPWLQSVRCSS
jgi:hypothetical protein